MVLSPKRSSSSVDCVISLTSSCDLMTSCFGASDALSTSMTMVSTAGTGSASTTGTVPDSTAGAGGFASTRADRMGASS